MLRESIFLVFAEDQLTIDDDVKDPAGAFDELGFDAKLVFDCLRQTGGLGQVISHTAVFDADLHAVDSGRIILRSHCDPSRGGRSHVFDNRISKRGTLQ